MNYIEYLGTDYWKKRRNDFKKKTLGEKEDEVPESRKETDIKYGDIFQLGQHRLMCGDATKKEDVEKLMNGEKIKLCFTSPPYNMASNLYENYADNLKLGTIYGSKSN